VPFRSGLAQRDSIYVSRHFHSRPCHHARCVAASLFLSSCALSPAFILPTRHLSILGQRTHEILRVDDVDDINPSPILPYCVVLRVVVSPLLHRLHASMQLSISCRWRLSRASRSYLAADFASRSTLLVSAFLSLRDDRLFEAIPGKCPGDAFRG